jgi:hypothetical protein
MLLQIIVPDKSNLVNLIRPSIKGNSLLVQGSMWIKAAAKYYILLIQHNNFDQGIFTINNYFTPITPGFQT